MSKKNRLPEIIIFAGPNGSGKTTITRMPELLVFTLMPTILKGQVYAVIWKLL